MKSIEISAKSVEAAVETALKELDVRKEDVEIEVLEEASKGLFGLIGTKLAKVKVTIKDTPADVAIEFLTNIFAKMNIQVDYSVSNKGHYYFIKINGKNIGILIGHHGETLDSLQFLTNLVVSRKFLDKYYVIVDIEGYREKREQTLIKLAERLASKVKRTGERIVLEPMTPQERRIIHTSLQNDHRIETFSEGNEPYRKVIIDLK